ncbi:AzlD domain-containing protein [uncultured Rhodospira sp.]|uniref:AzlD domain-containing protein n=1 Tax=uncultured Rhodospira sp. TaxID=1936189 RepID=UPI002632F408|nr:AzlD domain-containing protein [uncultured Rhodospira sp.]
MGDLFEQPFSAPVLWGLIVACGFGTWMLRLSFIQLAGIWALPRWLSRGLRYVPPAVLAALVVPAIVQADVLFTPAWDWTRLAAGLAAAAVALTKRVVLTLVVGMAALWIFMGLA